MGEIGFALLHVLLQLLNLEVILSCMTQFEPDGMYFIKHVHNSPHDLFTAKFNSNSNNVHFVSLFLLSVSVSSV